MCYNFYSIRLSVIETEKTLSPLVPGHDLPYERYLERNAPRAHQANKQRARWRKTKHKKNCKRQRKVTYQQTRSTFACIVQNGRGDEIGYMVVGDGPNAPYRSFVLGDTLRKLPHSTASDIHCLCDDSIYAEHRSNKQCKTQPNVSFHPNQSRARAVCIQPYTVN